MFLREVKKKHQKNSIEEIGFSEKLGQTSGRLIHKDGKFNVERIGFKNHSLYHELKEASSSKFVFVIFGFVFIINAIFAVLFLIFGIENLNGISISENIVENFFNAFFFSIQTFTTVGYGAINPTGFAANMIASIDALVGLLSFALFTGLIFARFSKPVASIIFSEKAIFSPLDDGRMSFQFRIVNVRDHKIIDVEAKVLVTWLEEQNGVFHRQYASLKLFRDKIFLFPLNWTIVHIIDEDSPLFGKTKADLQKKNAEFLVLVEGHDEVFSDRVHTNRSYFSDDIIWNAKFEIMHRPINGKTILDLDRIDNILHLNKE